MNKKISIAVLGLLGLAGLAIGQTTTTSTTLSTAMSRGDQTISLASSTGVTAASTNPVTGLYVDREYMTVTTLVSGNLWNVKRGVAGIQSTHASSSVVWVSVPGTFDLGARPRVGSCTSTSFPYLPIINVLSGDLQTCGNGQWVNFAPFAARLTVGAQLTAAATIVLTNPVSHITSSAVTITTITAPALPATGGCVVLIPDAAMTGATSSTGGNIALATTFVANKALTLCFDPTAARWYPSY